MVASRISRQCGQRGVLLWRISSGVLYKSRNRKTMLTTVDAQCYGPKRTGLLVAKNRALSLVIREGLLVKMVSLAMVGPTMPWRKPWESRALVRMTVCIVDQSPHVRPCKPDPNVTHERELRLIFPSAPPNPLCFEPPPFCGRRFQPAHRSHLHILICCLAFSLPEPAAQMTLG